MSLLSLKILTLVCRKGSVHDFRIFKESRCPIHPSLQILGDSGYQGIAKYHKNSTIPIKKQKDSVLSKEEKKFNHELSKKRIGIENVNRRCKIFRITKEVYRGKHKNYGMVWNVVAALVNSRYCENIIEA